MKIRNILFLLLLSPVFVYAQTVVDSEDFSSGGTGWTLNSGATGPNIWWVNNDYSFATFGVNLTPDPNDGANYLHIGSAGEPAYLSNNASTAEAVSKVFSTAGETNVSLSFDWMCDGQDNVDYGDVYYRINGGPWVNIPGPVAGHYSGGNQSTWFFDTLTAASVSNAFDNQTDIQLRFTWVNPSTLSGAADPPFCVDNITFFKPSGGPPPPDVVATLTDSTMVSCFGDMTGYAKVTASSGTTPYSYVWYDAINGGGSVIGGEDSAFISGLSAGSYSVIVTDAGPTSDTVNVTITQPSAALSIDTSGLTNISCFGLNDGSVNVSSTGGTGATEFSLDGSSFISTSSFSDTLVNGNNEIWVRDANGCRDSITVNVTEPTQIVIDTVSTSSATCFYSADGTAEMTASGGAGPAYLYDFGSGFASPSVDSNLAGNVTVYVKDASGCIDSMSFVIGGASPIEVEMSGDVSTCPDDSASITYTITGGTGATPYVLSWIPSTDLTDDASNNSAVIKPTSTYELTLQVTDSKGCPSNTDTILVTLNDLPDITLDSVHTIVPGTSANIEVTTTNGTGFEWSPITGLDDATSNPIAASPSETTTYTVVVETDAGCIDSAHVTVNVADAFEIFSSFTPNNDGVNDTWVIQGLEQYPTAQIEVFNRWGGVVYEKTASADYATNPWDGTYKNTGKELSAGTYYYVLTIESNGDIRKGAVELLK